MDAEVISPLPLTAAQAEVVRRARYERVTVVSGPPGNGKSHAVVAAALEAVDRGGSVLVATQSHHAAEVLGELLERYPGPIPVRFGDAESRGAIAVTLTGPGPAGHGGGRPAAAAFRVLRRRCEDVADALRRYQLDDRADVRRVSAYDLSAGAAPVVWLDQHSAARRI